MRKISLIVLLALGLAACGGSTAVVHNSTPPPPPVVSGAWGRSGFGAQSSAQKVAMTAPTPIARLASFLFFQSGGTLASSTPIAISGTYTGDCPSLPQTPNTSDPWTGLDGLETPSAVCGGEFLSSEVGILPTQPVYGDGTLTGLIVTGVDASAASTDGTVQVIVEAPGGTPTPVALSCALGVGPRCEATASVSVLDGSLIGAVMEAPSAGTYTNVHVVILKQ